MIFFIKEIKQRKKDLTFWEPKKEEKKKKKERGKAIYLKKIAKLVLWAWMLPEQTSVNEYGLFLSKPMKPNGNLRDIAMSAPEDVLRKAAKLPPLKKSGKEKHSLYRSLDEEDDELKTLYRRESALDYYDDDDTEEEWEEMDGDDEDNLPEDWIDEGETQDWEE